MEARNIPVQMIAYCDAEGEMKPLRFRYEDDRHRIHTVRVQQVVDRRTVEFVGIQALLILCKSMEEDREHLYELKYTVATHKWTLFRKVY